MGTEARTDFAADDRKLLAEMACAARLRMDAIPRPDAQGPLASWAQEGGLELRLRMLKRCVTVAQHVPWMPSGSRETLQCMHA